MTLIIRQTGPNTLRLLGSGRRPGAVSSALYSGKSPAYLLRRIARFANHDSRVLAIA